MRYGFMEGISFEEGVKRSKRRHHIIFPNESVESFENKESFRQLRMVGLEERRP